MMATRSTNSPADRAVPEDSTDACWQELEAMVASLHDLACTAIGPSEFYRSLLERVVGRFTALEGMAWGRTPAGEWTCLCQVGPSGFGPPWSSLSRGQVKNGLWHSLL